MLLNGGYAKPAKSADFFEMQSPSKVRIFLRLLCPYCRYPSE